MITLQETLRGVLYTPFYAAIERQAFATEGVEIRFVSSPTPAQALEGLMAGTVDVGWGGPLRVNIGNRTIPGADFVCFCEVITRDPFFLVTRHPQPPYTPAALKTLRIATVSEVPTPFLCLQHDLRLANIDPASINWLHGNAMTENAELLKAGTVDVIQCFQPVTEALIEDGCQVWSPAATRGPCSYTTLYTSRTTIDARREELTAMVRAIYKTQTWLHDTPAETLATTVATYFPAIPHPRLTAAIARYKSLGIWGQNPILPQNGYNRLVASMVTGGAITHEVPYEQAVDNTLSQAVMAGH